MTTQHSRRDFLRGQLSPPAPAPLRPPGALADFEKLCTGCGDCTVACPQGIVIRRQERSGTFKPVVDFSQGACTFCGACAEACATGALSASSVAHWPWRAAIGETCLSLNGVYCRTCEDACEQRAIRFRLMTGGRTQPTLDAAQCTGCGECAYTCPAGAVSFEQRPPAEEVAG